MSGTTTQPTAQRIATWGPVVVSVLAEVVFLVAMLVTYLKGDTETFKYLVVAAATNATGVVNYWIGSSAGSAKKTDMLAQTPAPTTGATP